MTEYVKFGGVSLVVVPGWCDITDDLSPGSPPTLAREDGVGVLQFSSATYKGGSMPNVGANELSEMLGEFAKAHGFERPNRLRTENQNLLIVSGDFLNWNEIVRAWYVTDTRNIAFITYVSQERANPRTMEELQASEEMVRSIRA